MSVTNSVVSAFRVLEAVAEAQPVGLSEVARATELPKSTTQRCLLTLQDVGWIRPSDTTPVRWSISYHAIAVCGKDSKESLREVALPVMSELQLATTETVHLCAPGRNDLVLIERLDTAHPLRAFLPLGARARLHSSATGLAFLAASTDQFIDTYLDGELVADTPDSLTDPALVREALHKTRADGFSRNTGGLSTGINSLGAALLNARNQPVGAISISGPSSRITPDRFDALGPMVREAAAQISTRLGAVPAT
ncbi:transcriptional regulator, IclR family [Saccharopolyspora kobensis]|uniref:Transcriptional regulator, IclR family n=1 Tax=Saccharopolyspora kobensis TaxID=146035 RepID=A0A1H5URT7_9PSEU|nr:IclR family transcriptional regulator [Saccharopolyspora kobensis]SEF77795.1 transcriptional regulator, IclR family [Saccharopolyspora kobensis]SFC70175.1 transcriptional regulator, IclR family [Saccharopolyspora kobensis]